MKIKLKLKVKLNNKISKNHKSQKKKNKNKILKHKQLNNQAYMKYHKKIIKHIHKLILNFKD